MSRPDDRPDDAPVPGLEDLYMDHSPPPGLEDRIVDSLRGDGWPYASSTGRPEAPTASARLHGFRRAAAALVLFAAGWTAASVTGGRAIDAPAPDVATEPTHMLVLWETPDFRPTDEPDEIAAAYGAWLGRVAEAGTPLSGNELAPAHRVHTPADPAGTGTDMVPPGSRIGGYFLVTEDDDQAVAELVAGHPHLANGGWIEVAPILRR